MSHEDSAPAALVQRIKALGLKGPSQPHKLRARALSGDLMPGADIITSAKNLVSPGASLFLSPKELSGGWDFKPQSSARA